MAGAREILSRINSIKDTRKITNAMYMISTAKLRKTRRDLEETRPYFENIQREISRIFDHVPDIKSKYILSAEGETKGETRCGCLVVTSDKGLAGAYNHNVLSLASDYMAAQRYLSKKEKTMLFVVGEYGRQYFYRKNIPVEKSFLYSAQNPSMERARDITNTLMSLYDGGELDEIHIIYTDMRGADTEVVEHQLLPIDRDWFAFAESGGKDFEEGDFFPSAQSVLNAIVPSYVTGFIYSALVDSFCSEQNARMLAMDAAGRSADDMLSELSVRYNRVRQTAITQEITEIAAGARYHAEKEAR